MAIHADYMTTLCRVYSQVYNGKSHHISLRHSLKQGPITNRIITLDYVNIKFNLMIFPLEPGVGIQLNEHQLQANYVNRKSNGKPNSHAINIVS